MVRVVIIDYLSGNLFSIVKAFKYIGIDPIVSGDPSDWFKADLLVFPGQGNFSQAMQELKKGGKDLILKDILENKMFLGICLGMQILFEESEEAPGIKGLSVFRGNIKRLPSKKVPHLGWNEVKLKKDSILFRNLPSNPFFYFVHSYYLETFEEDIIWGTTNYEIDFPSLIQSENIIGVQFHPEKSSKNGIKFIENLIREYLKC